MAGLDGLKEILLGADPGIGVNPDAGYIYKWVEFSGGSYLYKYKTNAGVVGDIGTSGGAVLSVNSGSNITVDNTDPINPIINTSSVQTVVAGTNITVDNTDPQNPIINAVPITTFKWMLQAGHSNLPGNGTESNFSYGNNSANDGVTMMRAGNVIGMSVRVEPGSTGSATYIITKNNVENNIAGQRIVVDGTVNVEGGIDNKSAALIFLTPFPYVRGDQIEIRAKTTGWGNTGSDSTVLALMEDTL